MCGGQTGNILRHVPRVLPGIAFGVVGAVAAGAGVERGAEAAIALARAHEAGVLVEGIAPVAGTLVEGCRHIGLAHRLCHARDGPIIEGVFQRLAGRFTFFVDRHVAQLTVLRDAIVRTVVGGLHHRLQRLVRVETTDTLHVGIGDHRHRVVADHAPVFQAMERPHRQHAVGTVLMMGQHGIDEIAVALLRLHQGQQGVQGTVGIPQRERRIIRIALGLVYGVVGAAVLAVGIHEQRRPQQRVVQRGVGAATRVLRRIDIQHRQRLRPLLLCLRAHAVEIEVGHFGIEVGDGARLADRRDRHLHHQRRLQLAEVERAHQLPPLDLRALFRVLLARGRKALVDDVLLGVVQFVAGQRPRETHREVQLAAGCPTAGLAETGDGAIATHAHPRPQDLPWVVIHAGAHVQQHLGLGALRECVAMHAHAGAGGQFGAHLVVVQGDRVVARLGLLVVMAEARGVTTARLFRVAALQARVAGERHQQDVAQV
ncbi:hypothetical protein D3C72_838670 [compost metagenome]